jgi:glutathione S-transferase
LVSFSLPPPSPQVKADGERYLHAPRLKVKIEEEFPAVWDWMLRIKERPAIKAAMEGAVFPEGATILKT